MKISVIISPLNLHYVLLGGKLKKSILELRKFVYGPISYCYHPFSSPFHISEGLLNQNLNPHYRLNADMYDETLSQCQYGDE